MERITITTRGGQTLPAIVFNGRTYRKHGHYYTCHRWKLHRDVWEYYNGAIPKGYQVHHKDFNVDNNEIENLVCLTIKEHQRIHTEENRRNGRADKAREWCNEIRPLASAWHRSEEGRRWHSEHARQQERKVFEFFCGVCGKSFTSKNPNAKYCSPKCNAKARRDSGVDNEARICPVCGRTFLTNKYGKQRICSLSCAGKHTSALRKGGESL